MSRVCAAYSYMHWCWCVVALFVACYSYLQNRCLITGNNNEAQAFLTKGAQVIVRMRGLPYDCTAKQVVKRTFSNTGEMSAAPRRAEHNLLSNTNSVFPFYRSNSSKPAVRNRPVKLWTRRMAFSS